MQSSGFTPPPNSLRKIIHDLNGEIFLLRGYSELTLGLCTDHPAIKKNITRMMERIEEIDAIMARLQKKQREIEPD